MREYFRDGSRAGHNQGGLLMDRATDWDYKQVAYTELDGYEVSTVWLSIDHRFGEEGSPLIFETMVFITREGWKDPQDKRSFQDVDVERYATEQEALEGHQQMVKRWKAKANREKNGELED